MSPSNSKGNAFSGDFSTYLDLLRFCAAYYVVLFHVSRSQIGPDFFNSIIPAYGHDAVILFFVLSGYVIAATADRKHKDGLRSYLVDRASRVYSVAIPALTFSALLSAILPSYLGERYYNSLQDVLINLISNFFFISQSWTREDWLHFNQPYWSLCYEVMYYILFGIISFTKGKARWIGAFLLAFIAGPKVLLLLPCWYVGVIAYKVQGYWKLNQWSSILIAFIIPPTIILLLHYVGFGSTARSITRDLFDADDINALGFSADFLIDYVTAMLVAVNLIAARHVKFDFPMKLKNIANQLAAMSFTLYLVHYPLVFIIAKFTGPMKESSITLAFASLGVPIICFYAAKFTEHQRISFRIWIDRLVPLSVPSLFKSKAV